MELVEVASVTTFESALHKFGPNKERLMRVRILAKTIYIIIVPEDLVMLALNESHEISETISLHFCNSEVLF